ncbi:hypothetical protein TrST_g9576 [Triparma strigata]|uniref:Uncharacterized protein n=3 Tax=Triparma TaxID=722752 RepID=A0A9W7BS66_9STRA|nr:hypothetical protein TrST_g9576 [Triparma strigata]
MSDVGRRLYQLYGDDKFLEDLHHEQQVELEEIKNPEVEPKRRGRQSLWNLKTVTTVSECDDLKAEKEHAEEVKKEKMKGRGTKFKKIKGRKSENHGDFFDFSPGLL